MLSPLSSLRLIMEMVNLVDSVMLITSKDAMLVLTDFQINVRTLVWIIQCLTVYFHFLPLFDKDSNFMSL